MAAAADVSDRLNQKQVDEDGNVMDQETVGALIESNQFNDFVDQVQDATNVEDESLFTMAYSHQAGDKEEDKKFLQIKFNKFAEQSWDEKGNKIPGKVTLTKNKAKKFAGEVLENWLNLSAEENESYLQ